MRGEVDTNFIGCLCVCDLVLGSVNHQPNLVLN